jgi:predicted acylesterase/phospholipase RssA
MNDNSNLNINITHLVLSGGGMHGVVFVGALRYLYLNNLHKNVTHIAGCSIGSFVGLMFAFKLQIEEMETLIYKIVSDYDLCNVPIKNYIKLVTEYGICDMENLIIHLKNFIKYKYPNLNDNVTFKDISKKFGINLYMSSTNINSCENKIFSIENTPDICVFDACCASMCIPLLFKPIYIDDYYYDGALTNNFPINIFDDVPCDNIIGMVLQKEERKMQKTKNISLIYILKQLFNILNKLRIKDVLIAQINNSKIKNFYYPKNLPLDNTININFTRLGMKFELKKEQIDSMIFAGFESMTEYIEDRYDKYIKKIDLDIIFSSTRSSESSGSSGSI